jgi:hypothetical protein
MCEVVCEQGLGEAPAGVLLGTWEGDVILLQNMKKPLTLCSGWNKMDSLAATDQIVVGGHVHVHSRRARREWRTSCGPGFTACRKDGYILVAKNKST